MPAEPRKQFMVVWDEGSWGEWGTHSDAEYFIRTEVGRGSAGDPSTARILWRPVAPWYEDGEDDRLTSLQAGLRAEVERLRKEIESADTMRTFCLREEERDLTAKYQGMEEAGRDCADRLENLLRESEGKGADQ